MFGLVTEQELGERLSDKTAWFKGEIEKLWLEFEERLRRINSPPTANELAQEALRKITEQVNPREFLENLLLIKGLTLEGLVRQAVTDYLNTSGKSLFTRNVVDGVSDRVWDELDVDGVHSEVVDRVSEKLFGEGKTSLLEEVAERVGDSVWDNLNIEDFYPYLGEKVVELISKKGV